jgi:phosphoenolpyruvate phosphomutase
MMKKSTLLRKIITSPDMEFLMEAHSGISAKIVEEAGFRGIWASSLAISASLGVRDNNEASWTQVVDVAEYMNDATTLPILLDGDTGYGNFNNARRLVRKLESRNIAGVCIEDKVFPKTNSLANREKQPLADISEFCGKIRAMKDIQEDPDFVVVARVEAFIAGWGLEEALARADEYRNAGADAILIHSKKTSAVEIEQFMKAWKNPTPIIVIPTKYYSTPPEKLASLGIRTIIWANHNLRASITAMQKLSRQLHDEQYLINIEDTIVPVGEVFRLQGDAELEAAEQAYLPVAGKSINAIILAASQGKTLGVLTAHIPKALLKIGGKPILFHQIDHFTQMGIKDIVVVRGFAKENVVSDKIRTIDNNDFHNTTELGSLYLARDEIRESSIISYGDLFYKSYILNELVNDDSDITIIADADYSRDSGYHEYVKTSIPYSKKLFFKNVRLSQIGPDLEPDEICGEFIGIFKVSRAGGDIVRETLEQMHDRKDFGRLRMKDLFMEILKGHPVCVKFIKGNWLDINTIADLQRMDEI